MRGFRSMLRTWHDIQNDDRGVVLQTASEPAQHEPACPPAAAFGEDEELESARPIPDSQPPFSAEMQLNSDMWFPDFGKIDASFERLDYPHLPEYPLVRTVKHDVEDFLHKDLLHHTLDDFDWAFRHTSTPRSNSRPLHEAGAVAHTVILTTNMSQHLLRCDDDLYIKPLPKYLTNHAFWETFLCGPFAEPYGGDTPQPGDGAHRNRIRRGGELRASALGFVRTYADLIQSKLDYDAAVRLHLVDPSVDFGELLRFLDAFRSQVADTDVTPRFRFGEVRVGWLLAALLRLRGEHFVHARRGAFLSTFSKRTPFVFSIFSAVFSAMQVDLAAIQLRETAPMPNAALLFTTASYRLAVGSLVVQPRTSHAWLSGLFGLSMLSLSVSAMQHVAVSNLQVHAVIPLRMNSLHSNLLLHGVWLGSVAFCMLAAGFLVLALLRLVAILQQPMASSSINEDD